jgi:2-amino-4-hydroxy-6-hydroxymethyldihydropteridine diphosphokinase
MNVHLGWGSNQGDRAGHWAAACEALALGGVRILRESSIYETAPVGGPAQGPFLNGAVEAETDLTPWQLLRLLKSIEAALGRRPAPRNSPRPIDLDILMMGETVLETRDLTVPHPRLAERRFVLVPLSEIAPRLRHPVLKTRIRELLRRCADASEVRLFLRARRSNRPCGR